MAYIDISTAKWVYLTAYSSVFSITSITFSYFFFYTFMAFLWNKFSFYVGETNQYPFHQFVGGEAIYIKYENFLLYRLIHMFQCDY